MRGGRSSASLVKEPELGVFMRSLNGVLPQDVSVVAVERAADGFDARRDALARTYCYRVLVRAAPSPFLRERALWWPHPLDVGRCIGARGWSWARTTSPRSLLRRPSTCDSSGTCFAAEWRRERGPARVLDRGRHLHASHGPRAGRDDARGGQRAPGHRPFAVLLEGADARRPGRPPIRMASTWNGCPTRKEASRRRALARGRSTPGAGRSCRPSASRRTRTSPSAGYRSPGRASARLQGPRSGVRSRPPPPA